MPSLLARIATAYTRRVVKPALGDLSDIQRVRRVFNARLPVPSGVQIEPAHLGGIPGEWVRPARRAVRSGGNSAVEPLGVMLYLHGGGFVGCSPRTHRPITAAFARRGWSVFVPDYRLAPEHPFPAALDDAVAAWRALVSAGHAGCKPESHTRSDTATHTATHAASNSQPTGQSAQKPQAQRLVVAGDSAGGQLCLALMLHEREGGRRLPDAAALLSPATDLSGGSASIVDNAQRDAMFHGPALSHLVEAYLQGADPQQMLASPLKADLHGLPPLVIHAGTDEALRDDATRLATKARQAGVPVQLQLWPVVSHVWQLLHFMPESRQSVAAMSAFLAEPPQVQGPEEVDVLIIGAGLSGIGAAAMLQIHAPQQRVAVVEAREVSGGTWDLFRYPGVRSDSDMYTLGYSFRPWMQGAALADGPAILDYLRQTARERGLDGLIRYGHRAVQADWDSAKGRWRVALEVGPQRRTQVIEARVVNACAGYYRYDQGHRPHWPGQEHYRGIWVHPQHWPKDLQTGGQRVVVIGSGATAVTLVPELARTAAQVTLLQRSPTYVMTLPRRDALANGTMKALPTALAWPLLRWRNIVLSQMFYRACRLFPRFMSRLLVRQAQRQAGPGVDGAAFAPRYAPWDQRLCIVPDGDLFAALRGGRASVATGEIAGFGERSVHLKDGRELPADLIVTATGLELQLVGGLKLSVDGRAINPAQSLAYKGVMFSGVPNFIATFGYTNASWTLKADLTARWMCRLLWRLERSGHAAAVPVPDGREQRRPFLDLSSGYVARAQGHLPAQGDHAPWQVHQSHWRNVLMLRFAPVADRHLRLLRPGEKPSGG